jgi:peptidase M23-like protein
MAPRRLTARSLLILLAAVVLLAGPASAPASGSVPGLIFPVVGPVTFTDDFGDARGSGRHEGNDIMAPKKSVAVAVEAGTVKFWTTSWRAGCMLYLYGRSGTTYLYIHLNNDRTSGNDNTGACVQGIAYARGLRNGSRVKAGQMVGYVGDSGDADGGSAHLHFEVHPGDGASANPYPHLLHAQKLLFAPQPGSHEFSLRMKGTVVSAEATSATLRVQQLVRFPGQLSVGQVNRKVELAVSPETAVFDPLGALIAGAQLAALVAGKPATVWTETQPYSLDAQLGVPLSMTAERITLTR